MQSSYISDLLVSVRLDGPITKGPKPRWQKTAKDGSSSLSSNSMSQSLNGSQNVSVLEKSLSKSKTPTRTTAKSPSRKTPGKQDQLTVEDGTAGSRKTPSKTPKASPRSKSTAVTPTWGDRFIPTRSGTDYELSHYLVTQQQQNEGEEAGEDKQSSHSKREQQRVMSEQLHGGDHHSCRVLQYQRKAPAAPEGHMNGLRTVYTGSRTPRGGQTSLRHIPSCPERVLDAPDIMDDYYLNLVDWGPNNILAVALRSAVYLWNESTGKIEQLMEMEGADDYISSVSWIQQGNVLAIGDTQGTVQLWDCSEMRQVRSMRSHSGRVSSLSWNAHVCSSGSRIGAIHHADVRIADFLVGEVNAHTQEVCGLKWCQAGQYLASGSNDNQLHIWARTPADMVTESTPLYTFSAHQAAVKALSWCPWQHGVLASGGGTADRHIRFWNCRMGASVSAIDTKSQVCSIVWSPHHKELVSGHGYANNELIVWKYPTMEKAAELVGHTQRVLSLCLSPDGTTVLSAGADETIRLWQIFRVDAAKKKSAKSATKPATSSLHGYMR